MAMSTGRRGRRSAAAVVAVGLLVTAVTAWWIGTVEERAADDRLEARADRAAFVLRTEIDRYVAAGAAVSAALSRDPLMGPAAYDRLLDTLSEDQDLTALRGLNAIRLVPADEVEDFARRQQSLEPLDLRLAEDVDQHAILFRVHPRSTNAPALGFDAFANPSAASALRRSLRLDAARMTDATTLQQSPDRQDGLVVYTPTRVDGEIVGWVSVVMEGQSVMDAISDGIDVRLRVVDQTPDEAVLLARANRGVEADGDGHLLRSLSLYGQTWRMMVGPLDERPSTVVGVVASSGLLITMVLAALVVTVARSERRAIELADERTGELAHANVELQRANTDLERAGRAKDDLVSAVSHELRTPLTIIRGFASTLARNNSELSTDARNALELIDLHAQRLDSVVSDMLLTARLANGEETPTVSRVPVVSHARAVVAQLPEAAELQVEVNGPAGVMALADVSHLTTILNQLLSNAVKYGAAPVAVDVEAHGDDVEIRVSDGGSGLSAETAASLFGQFAQADAGDRRRSRGVGLGLWLVQELSELNGGSARHEPGDRTTFLVRLPAVEPPARPSEHGRHVRATTE